MQTRHGSGTPAVPVLVGMLLLLVLALFWPTFVVLHQKWTYATASYSHGYLIVALSAWLIMRAANGLSLPGKLFWPALPLLFFSSLGWFLAWLADIMIVQALAIPAILYFVLLAAFGRSNARRWLFPVGYLLFAIPFWDYINGALQSMTIFSSTTVLNIAHVPAFIEGSVVQLPNGTFEIASGCSGLHFFIAALALATLYAYLFLNRLRSQLMLVVLAIVLSIAMNWFRVITIILAGYATDMQHYLVKVDHYNYGWFLFAVFLVPLYLVARRLEDADLDADTGRQAAAPADTRAGEGQPHAGRRIVRLLTVLVVTATGPAAALALSLPGHQAVPIRMVAPEQLGDWHRSAGPGGLAGIEFAGNSAEISRRYQNDRQQRVWLYANVYTHQAQGQELISSNNRLYAHEQWTPLAKGSVAFDTGTPAVNIRQLVSASGHQRLIAYWYLVAGKPYATEIDVKLAEIVDRLRGTPRSGIRIVAIDCATDCAATSQVLQAFLYSNFAAINKDLIPVAVPKEIGQ